VAEIKFQERAVAFIDVLGFSKLVESSVDTDPDREQLESLVSLLESAIPEFDQGVDKKIPKRLIPNHIYISDSIILSAPLRDVEVAYFNGLEAVVMRCIQLTHKILEAGYLLRGGIATGLVWHGDSNIVGPAYQEAYAIESKGCKPCILLSEAATRLWGNSFGATTRMCVLDHGTLMVNGLHDFYIPDKSYGGIERTYDKYSELASERIDSSLPLGPKAKWEWFSAFLESEKSDDHKWHGFCQSVT
jgi:class 3 adenylate cyclase